MSASDLIPTNYGSGTERCPIQWQQIMGHRPQRLYRRTKILGHDLFRLASRSRQRLAPTLLPELQRHSLVRFNSAQHDHKHQLQLPAPVHIQDNSALFSSGSFNSPPTGNYQINYKAILAWINANCVQKTPGDGRPFPHHASVLQPAFLQLHPDRRSGQRLHVGQCQQQYYQQSRSERAILEGIYRLRAGRVARPHAATSKVPVRPHAATAGLHCRRFDGRRGRQHLRTRFHGLPQRPRDHYQPRRGYHTAPTVTFSAPYRHLHVSPPPGPPLFPAGKSPASP